MIDFATLHGLTIPEGEVTQIADAVGNVLWAVSGRGKVVLEVAKITSNTYAAETTYENEEFILLDIYPKTNGTVSVTYGGLTKTITDTSGAEEPNAQQVFFGTFNGVSDSVSTPETGKLVIDGAYSTFAVGAYSKSKILNTYCGCITSVEDFGTIENIAQRMFRECVKLTSVIFPESITSIGKYAFYNCQQLALTELPNGITSIEPSTFSYCPNINITQIPEGVTTIGEFAFSCGLSSDNECLTAMLHGSMTLPSTIQFVDVCAFYTRTGSSTNGYHNYFYLDTLIILATTPPNVPDALLGSLTKIIVPKGYGEVYKTNNDWGWYKSKIEEVS